MKNWNFLSNAFEKRIEEINKKFRETIEYVRDEKTESGRKEKRKKSWLNISRSVPLCNWKFNSYFPLGRSLNVAQWTWTDSSSAHRNTLFLSQSFPLSGTDVARISFLRATETNANFTRVNSPTSPFIEFELKLFERLNVLFECLDAPLSNPTTPRCTRRLIRFLSITGRQCRNYFYFNRFPIRWPHSEISIHTDLCVSRWQLHLNRIIPFV